MFGGSSRSIAIVLKFVDQVTKPMQKTAKGVKGFVQKLKGKLKDVAEHARWASLVVGAAFAQMVKGALNMAAQFEQTVVGFKYLVGNAEDAAKILGDLKELAMETIFPTDQVIEMGKRLYATGIAGDDLKSVMRSLMSVTLATGGSMDELNRIGRAYSQMSSMAKVKTQELWQMVNAGVPVYRTLATAIKEGRMQVDGLSQGSFKLAGASGKLTKEFQKQQEKLPILNRQLEAAKMRVQELKDEGKEGSRTFLRAEAAMMRYQQRVNAAKDTVTAYNTAQSKQGKVIDSSGASMKEIMAALQNVGDLNLDGAETAKILAEEWNRAYGGIIAETTNTVAGQWNMLQDQGRELVFTIMGISNEGTKAGSVMDVLRQILVKLNDAVGWLMDKMENLYDWVSAHVIIWAVLGGLLGTFAGFIIGVVGAIAKIMAIGLAFGAVIGGLIGLISSNIDKIKEWGQAIADFLVPKFESAVTTIKGKFGPVVGWFKTQFVRFGQIADEWATRFTNLVYRLSQGTEPPFPLTWRDAPGVLKGAILDPMVEHVSEFMTTVKGKIQGKVGGWMGPYQSFKTFLATGVWTPEVETSWVDALEGIKQRMKTKLQGIKEEFELAKKWLAFRDIQAPETASTAEALRGLVQLFREIGQTIQDFFKPIWEDIKPSLQEAGQVFRETLLPALRDLRDAFMNLNRIWKDHMGQNADLLVTFFKIITVTLAAIVTVVAAIATGIVTAIAKMLPPIINTFTAIVDIVTAAIDLIVAIVTLDLGAIPGIVWEIVKGVYNYFKWMMETGKAIISGLVQGIINFFKGLWKALVGGSIIPDMVNAIVDWFKSLKDKVSGFVKALVTYVKTWIRLMVQRVVQRIIDFKNKVVNKFNEIKTNLISSARTLKEKVVEAITSMVSNIGSQIGGLASDAWNWGKDIINNMINGIKDAVRGAGKLAGVLLGKLGISREDLGLYQHGGIIPGNPGEPVPIIAHAGERIVSRTGTNAGGGAPSTVNINFSGPVTMDSEERVEQLAKRISDILGRQNELARYGAGF